MKYKVDQQQRRLKSNTTKIQWKNTSVQVETCSHESALLAVNQSCQLLTLKLDFFPHLSHLSREKMRILSGGGTTHLRVMTNKTDVMLIVRQSSAEYSMSARLKLILSWFTCSQMHLLPRGFLLLFLFLIVFFGSTPHRIHGHTALLIGFPEDTLFFIFQQK